MSMNQWVNLIAMQINNGQKRAIVVINAFGPNPVSYIENWNTLNSSVQATFNDMISWASSVDPNFPSGARNQITIQVINGVKSYLSEQANTTNPNSQIQTFAYSNLTGNILVDFDTMCSWATTIDSSFLAPH